MTHTSELQVTQREKVVETSRKSMPGQTVQVEKLGITDGDFSLLSYAKRTSSRIYHKQLASS